jgi:hypothetical protein
MPAPMATALPAMAERLMKLRRLKRDSKKLDVRSTRAPETLTGAAPRPVDAPTRASP